MAKLKKREIIGIDNEKRKKFEFDLLRMYFGEDYKASCGVTIRQPTIGDILEFGENKFYANLNIFVSNPTQYRVALWHLGVDWCTLTDFELFCSFVGGLDPEALKYLFPETDFSSFSVGTLMPEKEEPKDGEEPEEPEPVQVLYSDA